MGLSLTIQIVTLLCAFAAATGSIYNAFFVQRPWRQDDLNDRRRKNEEEYWS